MVSTTKYQQIYGFPRINWSTFPFSQLAEILRNLELTQPGSLIIPRIIANSSVCFSSNQPSTTLGARWWRKLMAAMAWGVGGTDGQDPRTAGATCMGHRVEFWVEWLMVFNGIQQVFRGIWLDLILLMVFNGDWEWEFFRGFIWFYGVSLGFFIGCNAFNGDSYHGVQL